MKSFLYCFSFLLLIGCKNNKTPLFAKDNTNENERNNNLFVFVGEQISWDTLSQPPGSMDGHFTATYKILQRVYGKYEPDTIQFKVFDHYGLPHFLKYKHSLLYVSKYDEKYYHEKYQFHDVYKTKNGRWAGPYWCSDSMYYPNIKPEKINFEDSVGYPAVFKDQYGDDEDFPWGEPYYKIVGNKKAPMYGNYVEELFKIKKEGVLTARGLFGTKKVNHELEIVDATLAEVKKEIPNKDKEAFRKACQLFFESIYKVRLNDFKKVVADTLNIFDSLVITKSLTDTNFKYLFRQNLLKKYYNFLILDTNFWNSIDSIKFSIPTLKQKIKDIEKEDGRIIIMSYNFDNKRSKKIALKFLRTKNGYILKSYQRIDFPLVTYLNDGYYIP